MDSAGRAVGESVRAIASGAVRAEGLELVDLEFRREPAGWVLRLFIDKRGGVGIDDCQRVSEVVGTLLEVEDPIPHAYTLEVSSPGLTRPLVRPGDWDRAVGGQVRIVTHQPVAGRQSLTGRLVASGPDSVKIEIEGEEVEVAHSLIARARRELEWPRPQGPAQGHRTGRRMKPARRR